MKLYRYEDRLRDWNYHMDIPHVDLNLLEYEVVKETPGGYWIPKNSYKFNNSQINLFMGEEEDTEKRWVSKRSLKRFAYPTEEEALNGFIARKRSQITILNRNLAKAKQAIFLALEKKKGGK